MVGFNPFGAEALHAFIRGLNPRLLRYPLFQSFLKTRILPSSLLLIFEWSINLQPRSGWISITPGGDYCLTGSWIKGENIISRIQPLRGWQIVHIIFRGLHPRLLRFPLFQSFPETRILPSPLLKVFKWSINFQPQSGWISITPGGACVTGG